LAASALVPACGAAEAGGDPVVSADGGPRMAHPRFDGEFAVTGLVVDGTEAPLEPAPLLVIETRFGGLTVSPGCNTYLGSFTLTEDGVASFTVTGGSDVDCGDLTGQEASVLAALAAVETWTALDGGFRLDGPGTSLTITGPD
jgi:heat shock protein HslJ